jgi:hypothetical protein
MQRKLEIFDSEDIVELNGWSSLKNGAYVPLFLLLLGEPGRINGGHWS